MIKSANNLGFESSITNELITARGLAIKAGGLASNSSKFVRNFYLSKVSSAHQASRQNSILSNFKTPVQSHRF